MLLLLCLIGSGFSRESDSAGCFELIADSASISAGAKDGTDPLRMRRTEMAGTVSSAATLDDSSCRHPGDAFVPLLPSVFALDSSLLMTICGTGFALTSSSDGCLKETVLLCFEISSAVFFCASSEYELGRIEALPSLEKSRVVIVVVETFFDDLFPDTGRSILARVSTGDVEGDRLPEGFGFLLGRSGDRLGEEVGDRFLLI